jgi:hypothetical protein
MLETVCIKIHDKEAQVQMTVFLKTTEPDTVFTFLVMSSDTVDAFRGRVAQKLEKPLQEVRLSYKGKLLIEGKLLDYNFENDTMVMLLGPGVKGGAAKRKLEIPKILVKNEEDSQQLCCVIDALSNTMTKDDFEQRFRGFR